MKKTVYIASTIMMLCSLSMKAQSEPDALQFWNTVTLKKTLDDENKWSVGLMTEYRHQYHKGVSITNQYFVRPSVSYKVLPWLNLQYQMDFAATSSGFQLRFIPEVTFSHKVGDFSFAFRQRVMTSWKVESKTNSTVLRSRAKVEYHIPQTPVGVIFAWEPYWCEFGPGVSRKNHFGWFQKARWYGGFNIKVTDRLSILPQYICQAYHNHKGRYDRRTYDDHVVYITFSVKL